MDYTEDVHNESLKCYQRCEVQSEHLTITTAEYPSKNTFENRDEMCLVRMLYPQTYQLSDKCFKCCAMRSEQ